LATELIYETIKFARSYAGEPVAEMADRLELSRDYHFAAQVNNAVSISYRKRCKPFRECEWRTESRRNGKIAGLVERAPTGA